MSFFLLQPSVALCQLKFETKQDCCDYWYYVITKDESKINTFLKYDNGTIFNRQDEESIMCGIECLLKLEGNKNDTPLRYTRVFKWNDIDLPPQPVEIAALYQITYLFDLHHDIGWIALMDDNGKLSDDEMIREAYKYYREWFEKVKEIGFKEARKMKLDPFDNKNIHWVKLPIGVTSMDDEIKKWLNIKEEKKHKIKEDSLKENGPTEK